MNGIGFAQPALAAAAAAAVAVPILIHLLLRRRRTPVEWAAMDLLREALRRVERRRRIERWLLLAVRCLLVLVAGLAIAAPFVGGAAAIGRGARTVVLLVDDSAASAERLAPGTALERSVAAANAVIDTLGPGDRVAVVRMSDARAARTEPASLDHRTARQALASLGSSERAADVPGAFEAAAAILSMDEARGTLREAWILSAFRAGTAGTFPPLPSLGGPDRPVAVHAAFPPAADGTNLRLASLEPVRVAGAAAGDAPMLRARIERDRGDGPLRTTLVVAGPSVTAPVERTVELAAGERARTVDVTLAERAGRPADALRRAAIASISADAQPIDDGRAVPLAPTERVRAVVVDRRSFDAGAGIDRLSPGEWVTRALSPGGPSTVDVAAVDPAALDARSLAGADTVVVVQPQLLARAQWELLAGAVARGATLVLTPAASDRPQAWASALRDPFGVPWNVALEAEDLRLPVALAAEQPASGILGAMEGELPRLAPSVEALRVLRIDPAGDANAVQLALADGTPFVLSWRPKDARGSVVVLASAPDLAWTTLPLKPLMVPLWQEIVAEGRRQATALRTVTVGSMPLIDRPGVVELRPLGADGAPVAGARAVPVSSGGRTAMPLERAGLYELHDGEGRAQGILAVVIDPSAASVAPVERERLASWIGNGCAWGDGAGAGATASGAGTARDLPGTAIAAWLLVVALLLAVGEALLANRFSHATAAAGPSRLHDPARVAAGRVA